MPLINLRNIAISYGSLSLFENINLSIDAGERVCLIGRNGVGKSTLLKLIAGIIDPDVGVVEKANSIKIALLPQDVPMHLSGTIGEIVTQSFNQEEDEWLVKHNVEKILSKMELDGNLQFESLSGGIKRRVLLATVLVNDPDVLMLDEPTNHLDMDAIHWLENFLSQLQKTLIFITHDRLLMQKIATHFIEIDLGQIRSFRGDYQAYLKHKQTCLDAEQKAENLFNKKLAQEEQWIRQGIKARRTRNEGRVRMLKKMREERARKRVRPGQVKLKKNEIELSGKIVFEVNNVNYAYNENVIINQFSSFILRGDKVGIIGPNGSGKSTLIKLLLGSLSSQSGVITQGTNLTIGYFDQNRLQLNDDKTVFENISELSDTLIINDRKIHIMSYLQDFLFSPSRARTLVKSLSGGERNRVMLAKLFSKPCNVLVLDEPTNDLDFETLELLEEQLVQYSGTLLLVSHDRAFLNNVVTSILAFEENGAIGEYVGGYDDWLTQRLAKKVLKTPHEIVSAQKQEKKPGKKLSFNEQRELSLLPNMIESMEAQLSALQEQLNDPLLYKNCADQVGEIRKTYDGLELKLSQAYERWEELDKKL